MDDIETLRTILRKPRIQDLEDFYYYARKPNIGPDAGWLPHETIEDSKKILNEMIEKNEVWAITIKPNDKMVGTFGIHVNDFFQALNNIAEIGYVLDDEYWNMGIMSEVLHEMIKIAFTKLNYDKLLCGHHKTNYASKRVILKNNFKFSYIDRTRLFANEKIRAVYMYELLRKDFK